MRWSALRSTTLRADRPHGLTGPAPELGKRIKLPRTQCNEHPHRRALLERKPHVLVVQLGKLERHALQLFYDLCARSFDSMPVYDEHELVGPVEAGSDGLRMRLLLE